MTEYVELLERLQSVIGGDSSEANIRLLCDGVFCHGRGPEHARAQKALTPAQRLQRVEERFREALKGRAKQIEWRSEVAEPISFKESRAADLVIAGKTTDDTSLDPADLVMQTGRPLLMIPNGIEIFKAERILIAWKDTCEEPDVAL